MIIAIPVNDKQSNEISKTFGRAKYFMFFNTDTKTTDYVDNEQNLNSMQGAGIQSAQCIAEKNADVLLTKNCGPKAYRVLKASNVKIYLVETDNIDKAIKSYLDNQLVELSNANVEGHWS